MFSVVMQYCFAERPVKNENYFLVGTVFVRLTFLWSALAWINSKNSDFPFVAIHKTYTNSKHRHDSVACQAHPALVN